MLMLELINTSGSSLSFDMKYEVLCPFSSTQSVTDELTLLYSLLSFHLHTFNCLHTFPDISTLVGYQK
jgi:hypothetical protein